MPPSRPLVAFVCPLHETLPHCPAFTRIVYRVFLQQEQPLRYSTKSSQWALETSCIRASDSSMLTRHVTAVRYWRESLESDQRGHQMRHWSTVRNVRRNVKSDILRMQVGTTSNMLTHLIRDRSECSKFVKGPSKWPTRDNVVLWICSERRLVRSG